MSASLVAPIRSAATGAFLWLLTIAWVVVTAAVAGSDAGPTVAVLAATGLTVAICAAVASRRPTVVLAGVVGAAIAVFATDARATLTYGPLQGPFGYANATGAFFAQASIAALMLLVCARVRALRFAGALAAAAFAGLVLLSRSWAAVLLLVFVPPVALLVERARGARSTVALCGGLFVVVLILTVAIGALRIGTGRGPLGDAVRATISEQRIELWHDALALTAEDPVFGVGPGRLAVESPIAASDPDRRWAHHEFLQAGAETGLPGFVLSVSLVLWGFSALWLAEPGRLSALAAAGLAIVAIHASVDYVLHFPAVALVGAAVLGTGLGARSEPVGPPATVALPEPVGRSA